jgi:hypothetical protein
MLDLVKSKAVFISPRARYNMLTEDVPLVCPEEIHLVVTARLK